MSIENMAKSLRSKWRRRCRAVKRERYGAKELARLKKTLGIEENAQGDVEMSDMSQIVTVTDATTLKNSMKEKSLESSDDKTETMDEDGKRVYNKKTMLDQHGNYPVWMSRRKIMKHKKGRAKTKRATKVQDKRLTRKQRKVIQPSTQ